MLVEALEDEFIPLLVFNNQPGRDDELRQRFTEPAWNNPVLRFLDADGKDVLARRDGIWSSAAVAARLVDALTAAKRPVPAYLANLAAELAQPRAQALFTMYCYWEGEAAFGAIEGVVATRAVDLPAAVTGTGKVEEGVLVDYLPGRVTSAELIAAWKKLACADRDLSGDAQAITAAIAAKPSDRKHALRATPLWRLPMTPLQQARANAALAAGGDPLASLSPRQARLARRLEDASEFARTALAELEPAESLEGFAAWHAQVAALFTQTESAPAADR